MEQPIVAGTQLGCIRLCIIYHAGQLKVLRIIIILYIYQYTSIQYMAVYMFCILHSQSADEAYQFTLLHKLHV